MPHSLFVVVFSFLCIISIYFLLLYGPWEYKAKAANQHYSSKCRQSMERFGCTFNILSTFFQGFSVEDRLAVRPMIHSNIIASIKTLCEMCEEFGEGKVKVYLFLISIFVNVRIKGASFQYTVGKQEGCKEQGFCNGRSQRR